MLFFFFYSYMTINWVSLSFGLKGKTSNLKMSSMGTFHYFVIFHGQECSIKIIIISCSPCLKSSDLWTESDSTLIRWFTAQFNVLWCVHFYKKYMDIKISFPHYSEHQLFKDRNEIFMKIWASEIVWALIILIHFFVRSFIECIMTVVRWIALPPSNT